MRYLIVVLMLCGFAESGAEFTGDNLSRVLDEKVGSSSFIRFSSFWLLDAQLTSPENGLRLTYNPDSFRIDTVLIAGYGYRFAGKDYYACPLSLPYGIQLNDDVESVKRKMNTTSQKLGDDFLLTAPGVSVLLNYVSYGKMHWIKVFKASESEIQQPTPPTAIYASAAKTELPKTTAPTKPVVVKSDVATRPAASVTASAAKYDPDLKNAIMEVFHSWQESSLQSIKSNERTVSNFWNYKYTYSTRVKIPGELFNMIYSFPFVNSQLDFVSVLKQADRYDSSFETVYKNFEKKLAAAFPEKEGWVASCLPNTDGSKLSDLEFRNDRLGSIILDYSRNPKGKHILYIRFLLYSN